MTRRERARANAYKLRAEGLSIVEVAKRLGVPRGTVGGWLQGVGECSLIRECELCGERFITGTAKQRFCTASHAGKHWRLYGRPARIEVYRERARALEAELARLRERLTGGDAMRRVS